MSLISKSFRLGWPPNITYFPVVSLVSLSIWLSAGIPIASHAQPSTGPTLYSLNKDSNFQRGCFAPCECPIIELGPLKGTFILTPRGFDGLYDNYVVTDLYWKIPTNGTAVVVTGSGTYKIGGEFALQQELSLALQMDGGAVQSFNSGLVPVSATFPDIKVAVSTNGQRCFDTVFNVSASPIPVPQLHISLADSHTIVLSWTDTGTSFVLQESSDFVKPAWTTVSNSPNVLEAQKQVVLPVTSGNKCYRLRPNQT